MSESKTRFGVLIVRAARQFKPEENKATELDYSYPSKGRFGAKNEQQALLKAMDDFITNFPNDTVESVEVTKYTATY